MSARIEIIGIPMSVSELLRPSLLRMISFVGQPTYVIKLPLSGSSDTGEGTIWQMGVLKVLAGEWAGSVMMLFSAENSMLEMSGLVSDLRSWIDGMYSTQIAAAFAHRKCHKSLPSLGTSRHTERRYKVPKEWIKFS